MRQLLLGLMLAGAFGSATAGDLDAANASRYPDSDDFSAKVFYSLAFGGETQGNPHSVGLRFDNDRLAAHGAPALFQARFDGQGNLAALKLNGLDLRGAALAAGQSEGGMFAGFTTVQWVGLAVTGVLFAVVAADVSQDDTEPAQGTGGS